MSISVSSSNDQVDGKSRATLEDFLSVKLLGKGSAGTVTKVMHKTSGNVYALKSIPKRVIVDNNLKEQLLAEVRVQMTVKHTNLLECYHYFENRTHFHLVLEFAIGGDLYSLLRKKRLEELDAAHIFAQVSCGVKHLHSLHIVHRDLKPENIMLLSGLHAKIADFGWCSEKRNVRTTICGTVCMIAPEMILGNSYDHRVDIWALGVLLFEMLAGYSPFEAGDGMVKTCERIVGEDLSEAKLAPLPAVARTLITGLLQRDMTKRLTLKDALAHVWVVRCLEARSSLSQCATCEVQDTSETNEAVNTVKQPTFDVSKSPPLQTQLDESHISHVVNHGDAPKLTTHRVKRQTNTGEDGQNSPVVESANSWLKWEEKPRTDGNQGCASVYTASSNLHRSPALASLEVQDSYESNDAISPVKQPIFDVPKSSPIQIQIDKNPISCLADDWETVKPTTHRVKRHANNGFDGHSKPVVERADSQLKREDDVMLDTAPQAKCNHCGEKLPLDVIAIERHSQLCDWQRRNLHS